MAMARCVLPVPNGPSSTKFSARSTKPSDASAVELHFGRQRAMRSGEELAPARRHSSSAARNRVQFIVDGEAVAGSPQSPSRSQRHAPVPAAATAYSSHRRRRADRSVAQNRPSGRSDTAPRGRPLRRAHRSPAVRCRQRLQLPRLDDDCFQTRLLILSSRAFLTRRGALPSCNHTNPAQLHLLDLYWDVTRWRALLQLTEHGPAQSCLATRFATLSTWRRRWQIRVTRNKRPGNCRSYWSVYRTTRGTSLRRS